MKLTTSELVYINEAAKALKQKEFILIDNAIIGLDNIQSILTYILLDSNFIQNYHTGIIINQRALSSFIKKISIESEFVFDYTNNIIRTISGEELVLLYNNTMTEFVYDKFKYGTSIDYTNQIVIQESEVVDIFNKINNMKSADGGMGINYNGFYMTLFPTFLPTNKNDKMYITIFQPIQMNTFIAKFHIKKKKFDIITYIKYLKV